jgi:hypothetical protein
MNKLLYSFQILISFVLLLLVIVPIVTLADDTDTRSYTPLLDSGLSEDGSDFNTYINRLYYLAIGLAALLAVIKIVIAGVKWTLSDVVTDKSSAKEDIRGALTGLVLILGAVLILNTINPQLTRVETNFRTPTSTVSEEVTVTGPEPTSRFPINCRSNEIGDEEDTNLGSAVVGTYDCSDAVASCIDGERDAEGNVIREGGVVVTNDRGRTNSEITCQIRGD